MPVRLERRNPSGEWELIAAGQTDADGRCAQLLPADSALGPGVYRLVFDTEDYQRARNVETLYPLVEIVFTARKGESHFHLPLLLSPCGYTTYRGS